MKMSHITPFPFPLSFPSKTTRHKQQRENKNTFETKTMLPDKPESPYLHLQGSAPPLSSASPYPPTKASEPTWKLKKWHKITCVIVTTIVVVMIFLFFALFLFKKRAVEITTNNASLEKLSSSTNPITLLDLVIGVDIGIKNPNYAGFDYKSSNTKIFYHGIEAGSSPMPAGTVKARSSKNIHSTVYMKPPVMMSTPFLLPELVAGRIPLTSTTSLEGKVVLFNIIKIHATVETSCEITVNLQSTTTTADCKGDVKIS